MTLTWPPGPTSNRGLWDRVGGYEVGACRLSKVVAMARALGWAVRGCDDRLEDRGRGKMVGSDIILGGLPGSQWWWLCVAAETDWRKDSIGEGGSFRFPSGGRSECQHEDIEASW